MLKRREFIKGSGMLLTSALGASLFNCAGLQPRTLEETLRDYGRMTKGWDPIFGQKLLWWPKYGGIANFKGHKSDLGEGADSPGIDYLVYLVPIVPAGAGFLHKTDSESVPGLFIWLRHTADARFRTNYSHLSETIIDKEYYLKGNRQRLITPNEIIAISGNTGMSGRIDAPYHLHFGLEKWDPITKKGEFLDPEKYGIDGGKLVFSDGETNLSIRAEQRLSVLEKVLGGFGNRLQAWRDNELQELKGNLDNYYNKFKDSKGTKILDSKHFIDMKNLLKKVTLEQKKYIPGTKPYSMMLKIVGYSTDERQPIILMLPYIAPSLVSKYQKSVYTEGKLIDWREGYKPEFLPYL